MRCLDELGNPQNEFLVVHVTGTNGKGSVCMLLSKFLRIYNKRRVAEHMAMGSDKVRTTAVPPHLCWGVFTSPSLLGRWDMIEINGSTVDRRTYEEKEEALGKKVQSFPALTEFEKSVVIAMTLFRDNGVRLGIVEAGIGHELDATNAFSEECFAASVMTSISIDHSEVLGATVEEIIGHKVQIGKKGRAMLVSPQSSKALTEMIVERCRGQGISPVHCVEKICKISPGIGESEAEYEIHGLIDGRTWRIRVLQFPLLGEHQREANLPTAICAFMYVMIECFKESDEDLIIKSIASGWDGVRFPGRLEKIDDVSCVYSRIKARFLPGTIPGPLDRTCIVVDGAHNVGGMHALTKFVRKTETSAARICWVIGITDGKDTYGILSQIKESWAGDDVGTERCFYFVGFRIPESMKWVKCTPPQRLGAIFAEVMKKETNKQVSVVKDMSLEEALVDCIKNREGKIVIIICGSLYLMAEFYRLKGGPASPTYCR